MFWGLIMEPGRCYTQTVKVSFHVSMAALDISNSTEDPAQVMCVFEGRNYLLCTLKKKDMIQCPLDLNFEAGSKVSFATNGKAHVHLTGYLTNFESLDEEELEEESEKEIEEKPSKEKKRIKKEQLEEPPSKKSKVGKNKLALELAQNFVENEESSDSDFDIDNLMEAEEEEEDDDSAEEEEEDLEEEEEEEDASSLSEQEPQPKPKQNGIAKTPKKSEKTPKPEKKIKPKKTVLKGGVVIQDLQEGTGEPVKEGKFVHVYYEGRLKESNKLFDSTTKGPGFSFRVGKGEVIKGWDVGLVGMKVGGKRRITCPPKVAYGPKGSPPVIPPNAVLIFDVEVKKIS